jgi:hypothetical protein
MVVTSGELNWRRAGTAIIPPRMGASLVRDEASGEVLVFGGVGPPPTGVLNDLWAWRNGTWTQRSSAGGPGPRASASMAYDRGSQSVLLFGGMDSNGRPLGDSWTWNGVQWTEVTSTTSPPARAEASMCTQGDDVLLFGGRQVGGRKSVWLADTWVWRGGSWTEFATESGPSARSGAAMAYDQARGVAILFGGSDGGLCADTWTWNGSTWHEVAVTDHPSARAQAAFAFHAGRGVAVLHGGHGNGIDAPFYLSDVWRWDGQGWGEVPAINSPGTVTDVVAAYDSGSSALLVLRSTTQKFVQATTGRTDAPVMSTDAWLLS